MSYTTISGNPAEGQLLREPQMCLGAAFAQASYHFFVTQTTTPANVYQDGDLTTPFSPTGVVTADNYGRFPPIYLDTSITYGVQFYNINNDLIWTVDPYVPPLATTGTSSNITYGLNIDSFGDVTIPTPSNAGGSGVSLTLNAGVIGSAPLQISATQPGNAALVINNSATTGTRTATFTAANKPGTATSSPAGWLPIVCDGVQYYAPIWHGNNFEYYVANPSAQGLVFHGFETAVFGGNGSTAGSMGSPAYGLPANPGNWFSPLEAGVGAGYYINITKTGGLSGLSFSSAQGSWTNIGSSGLTITQSASSSAPITGTYQMSTSDTGSPVVASGTLLLANLNGVQSNLYNVITSIGFDSNGATSSGGSGAQNNWFSPITTDIGSSYWINITRTGGSAGVNFTNAQGSWVNISDSGLLIGLSSGTAGLYASGTYQIASDSGGVNILGSGSITVTNT